MSIVIYWISKPSGEGLFPNFTEPKCRTFASSELGPALKLSEELRREGHRHVCISSEHDDQVGGNGVDTVADGKTPDGHPYEWSKQHRGAGPRSA
jgi:hypothetical protein